MRPLDDEAHDDATSELGGLEEEAAEAERQGECMRAVTDLLLSTLPKRERNILRLRYGLLSGGGSGGAAAAAIGSASADAAPELGCMSLGVRWGGGATGAGRRRRGGAAVARAAVAACCGLAGPGHQPVLTRLGSRSSAHPLTCPAACLPASPACPAGGGRGVWPL